jgi:hypothetical protein
MTGIMWSHLQWHDRPCQPRRQRVFETALLELQAEQFVRRLGELGRLPAVTPRQAVTFQAQVG